MKIRINSGIEKPMRTPPVKFTARIKLFPTENGGRKEPVSSGDYFPNIVFDVPFNNSFRDFDRYLLSQRLQKDYPKVNSNVSFKFPDHFLYPGDQCICTIRLYHPERVVGYIMPGDKFLIIEITRFVGVGEVLEFLNDR
jgi:hypothetical protein